MTSSRHAHATGARPRRSAALFAAASLLIALCGHAPGARAQSSVPRYGPPVVEGPVSDGVVRGMATDGTTMFVGGAFAYVGPDTGASAFVDAGAGLATPARLPVVRGTVRRIVPDGRGGWLIGGDLTRVGGWERRGLAHVLADGTVDDAFPDASDAVYAIAVDGPSVYVGGRFHTIGGKARALVACVDLDAKATTSFDARVESNDGVVRCAAVADGVLYVGGSGLGRVGSRSVSGFAAFRERTGELLPIDPGVEQVRDVLVDGPTAFLAGERFDAPAGGGHVVRVDLATGRAEAWDAGEPTLVATTLSLLDGTLYAGGSTIAGATGEHPRAIAVDAATGAPRPWDARIGGPDVARLVATPAGVYVAGGFSTAGGLPRRNAALLDRATGDALAWDPKPNHHVETAWVDGDRVALGGEFSSAGGASRTSLAAFDLASGAVSAWDAGATHPDLKVYGLAVADGEAYVAGVETADGRDATSVFAVDAATGTRLDWTATVSGTIEGMGVVGGRVYLDGVFSLVNGETRNGLAALDARTGRLTDWASRDLFFRSGLAPRAFAVDGAGAVVVGDLTTFDGRSASGVVLLDLESGAPLPFRSPQGVAGVYAATASGDVVYACVANAAPTDYPYEIVALDRATGERLPWRETALLTPPVALVANGSVVCALGKIVFPNGDTTGYLGLEFDAATGERLPWAPRTFFTALTGVLVGDRVYAGGDFKEMESAGAAQRIAEFGPSRPVVRKVTVAGKHGSVSSVTIEGGDFDDGVVAYVGGDARPWPKLVRRSDLALTLGGKRLARAFRGGVAVPVRLVNPDGGEVVATVVR